MESATFADGNADLMNLTLSFYLFTPLRRKKIRTLTFIHHYLFVIQQERDNFVLFFLTVYDDLYTSAMTL